jgi:hypothetical protein
MPIQLIITGDHITDVFAEISNFAAAIGGDAPKNEAGATSGSKGSTASAPSPKTAPASTEAPATGGKTDAKLTRNEQDAAVEEMVEAGEKDARYEQLTKGRKKAVDDGIAKKAEAESTEDALSDMFDDTPSESEEEEVEITADTIRDMMGKLGKDAKGNPIQENLLKIKSVLEKAIPKGVEIKVGNIPADKLQTVFAELKKLEG